MRSRFIFCNEHDQWLIDHAGGIPGNVDLWAYTPELNVLVCDFNEYFSTNCTHNEILDRLIRGLEKKRYTCCAGEVKLTKFMRAYRGRLPVVSCEEQDRLYAAYKRENVPLDRIPYTSIFNRICSRVPRLTHREVWRYLQSRRKIGQSKGGLPRIRKKLEC